MKSAEYTKGLRGKDAGQMQEELLSLRKEQFNLRMQAALGQQPKSHLVRNARKNIARVKTLLTQSTNTKASAK